MNDEQSKTIDPRIAQALTELEQIIRAHYPSARFAVTRSGDEPENVHLLTTVDLADPDDVVDLVLDRLVEFQVEERIPVYVIPVRTPDRILADRASQPGPERGDLRLIRDSVLRPVANRYGN